MADKRICSVDGCGKPMRGRGLCNAHRIRLWRHGDATVLKRQYTPKEPAEQRFFKYIERTDDGCWLWTGSLNNKGYGEIGVDGKTTLAHRLSYFIHVRELTPEELVLHRCDTPRCVNPDHLFLGTQSENMADCKSKGRTTSGSKNGRAKLSEREIPLIRKMWHAGLSQPEIAARFGITPSNVSLILVGKRWGHVP